MQRNDRWHDCTGNGDDIVSPYLRLPLRSYIKAIGERERRARRDRPWSELAASPDAPCDRPDNADRGGR